MTGILRQGTRLADLSKKGPCACQHRRSEPDGSRLYSRSDPRGQALTTILTSVDLVSKVARTKEDPEKARVWPGKEAFRARRLNQRPARLSKTSKWLEWKGSVVRCEPVGAPGAL